LVKRSLSMKMRVLPAPQRGSAPTAIFIQIRCTGTAYGDFRSKSAAQVPRLLTFASMSLQIRCTGTAYGDIITKSAAQAPHMLTFASMSLQIRCTGTAYAHFRTESAAQAPHMLTFAPMSLQIQCTSTAYYAHFRCNFVVNQPSLRTETPSSAVWAKPSWINTWRLSLGFFVWRNRNIQKLCCWITTTIFVFSPTL